MPDEITITPFSYSDLEEACTLAPDDEGVRGRLCWHLFTPYAALYKAETEGEMAGYACGVLFPGSGWLREVFVAPASPRETVAPRLIDALVKHMEANGASRQLVIASEAYQPLFRASGFQVDGGLLSYAHGTFLQATKDEVLNLEPEHMLAVLRLDKQATGEDRERLLREHSFLGSVYQEGTRVRGFSLPLLGHGLIVADCLEVGLELQRWLLPLQPYLRLPVGHLAAHGHMISRKYTATRAGVRMVRGVPPEHRPTMIYAHP